MHEERGKSKQGKPLAGQKRNVSTFFTDFSVWSRQLDTTMQTWWVAHSKTLACRNCLHPVTFHNKICTKHCSQKFEKTKGWASSRAVLKHRQWLWIRTWYHQLSRTSHMETKIQAVQQGLKRMVMRMRFGWNEERDSGVEQLDMKVRGKSEVEPSYGRLGCWKGKVEDRGRPAVVYLTEVYLCLADPLSRPTGLARHGPWQISSMRSARRLQRRWRQRGRFGHQPPPVGPQWRCCAADKIVSVSQFSVCALFLKCSVCRTRAPMVYIPLRIRCLATCLRWQLEL